MTHERTLPASPRLDQQRKLAKELLNGVRERDPGALDRIVASHPRFIGSGADEVPAELKLAEAQLVLAREYGFASWNRLKDHIDAVTGAELSTSLPFEPDLDYYRERAKGLHSVHGTGERRSLRLIRLFHPRFQGASEEEIRGADFTQEDAELVLAREHGFDDFASLAEHVERIRRGEESNAFADAWRKIQAGEALQLSELMAAHPEVANARGTNGNRLLGLSLGPMRSIARGTDPEIGAGGRARRVEIVRALLAAGADPDLPNDKGTTALHQVAYGEHEGGSQSEMLEILELLLAAGASVDAETYGDGGTPLMLALFWGHRPQAERLAGVKVSPANLRVAAGLGRIDLMHAFFDDQGRLRPEAGRHREFHRPHSGFPPWKPSNDPQEILDEALVYAAKSGRIEAMAFLLERGADIDGEPYNGTPLFWAILRGWDEAAIWLLDRGADPLRRASVGFNEGMTAIHVACAWDGRREVVRALLERGVPVTVRDDMQQAGPVGWAAYHGNPEIRADLIEVGSRTDVHLAVLSGRVDRVAALVEADRELIDRLDPQGRTPLDLAVEAEENEVADWLRGRGARTGEALASEAG